MRTRLAALLALGLASSSAAADGQAEPSAELREACSLTSPGMQTAALGAMITSGGPLAVDVIAWMCGRTRAGVLVRVVFVRYPVPDEGNDPTGGEIVPVVYEAERLVAHGWGFFELHPNRYEVQLPSRAKPLVAPPGWVLVRHVRGLA